MPSCYFLLFINEVNMAKRRNPKKKRRYGTRRMPESFVNELRQEECREGSNKDHPRVKKKKAQQQQLTLTKLSA
jgi:hypothetical protein